MRKLEFVARAVPGPRWILAAFELTEGGALTHLGWNVQYHQLTYAGVADQTVFINLPTCCRLMSLGKVMVEKLLQENVKKGTAVTYIHTRVYICLGEIKYYCDCKILRMPHVVRQCK